MGEVVLFPADSAGGFDMRKAEAALLRRVILEGRVRLTADEVAEVAKRVDGFIARFAGSRGRGGVAAVCGKVWPGDENPARHRPELRRTKKPKTLARHVERIAEAAGVPADDLLLEAFRGSRIDAAVGSQLRGDGTEPELEAFWVTLSTTFHALAAAVTRKEGLEQHAERMVALGGAYDLSADSIRPVSDGRLLDRPLANWNNHWSEFPPIPSVVLFAEPKSVTVARNVTVRKTGKVIPVRMTVLREVRLAIGPADHPLVPAPLFEFRSVLRLVGPDGALRVRCPWLYLNEDEVELEIEGTWQVADIPFEGPDLQDIPEAHPPKFDSGQWRFPARLELPLQYEHAYIVWRPVTADTCRALLLRPRGEVALGPFAAEPAGAKPETFCPPGTLAEAIETALHAEGPGSLPTLLRAEAARMVALVRGWHAARAGTAEAAHRELRARWEDWT